MDVRPERRVIESTCDDACCSSGGQPTQSLAPDEQQRLTRRVRMLVAATITYNVIEAVIAISAGAARGLDSAHRVRPRLGDRGQLSDHRRLAVLQR